MKKLEFILSLNDKLSGLPKNEIEERINFYVEMIEDRMEEGLSEEEAVAAVGSIDEIAEQIVADIPLSKIAKERIKPKRELKTWEIVLLVLGFPLWFPLLIAAVSVVFSIYAVLWSVIITLWSAFAALIGSAIAVGVFAIGIVVAFNAKALAGIALIGASLVLAGLSILFFFGCTAATKGLVLLTKKIAMVIKNSFIKKEAA